MNHWLQTRQYMCRRCRVVYLHDKAYFHDLFLCLMRVQGKVAR